MGEDVTIQILTLFEHLDRAQKTDLARLLNTIYGPGPHHEVLLRRIKGLICMALEDAKNTNMHVEWPCVAQSVCEWIDNELDIGKAKEYTE